METATMNKTELRAARKDAQIKNHSKMTVAGMREALTKLTTPTEPVVKRTRCEERNGARKPIKGVCADVWLALDELRASGDEDRTTAIRAIDEKRGWNRNNVSIELSAHRRFHGISTARRCR